MLTPHSEWAIRRPAWRRLVGAALKRALAWRYRHFRPGDGAGWARVGRWRLWVGPGVFNPALHFTSPFLAECLLRPGCIPRGGAVLDLGTGSGLAAIAAAQAGAGRVVATDLNPAAVRTARRNLARYGLTGQVVVRHGDLFAPVAGERFDVIISNPPYLRGTPQTLAERAYYGGPHWEWLQRFAAEAPTYLTPGGRCLVVLGDAAPLAPILAHLAAPGWRVVPIARRDILVEILYLFAMTR